MSSGAFGQLNDAAEVVTAIDPALLLLIFLPMLIFESAFSLEWHVFKQLISPALILAIPGLLISIGLTGTVVHYIILPEFGWNASMLLGTLLSATDPVAVVALLRTLGGPVRLATLIESESLLNDGTAIVAFEVFLELARGVPLTAGEIVADACQLALGGPALGLLFGVVTVIIIGYIIDDDLVEVTLTFAAAYLAFYVAEDVAHVSGVLCLVVLGLCFASGGKTRISPSSEHGVHTWWRILTYHGNTLIFLFVGVAMVLENDFGLIDGRDWGMVVLLWIFLYIVRALMLFLLTPALRLAGYNLTFKEALLIVHGGLRGAVSLALALAVSLDSGGGEHSLPAIVRDKTLFYAGGIAILTLLINATTTPYIINRLGLTKEPAGQRFVYERASKNLRSFTVQQAEKLSKDKLFSMCNWDEVVNYTLPVISSDKGPAFKVSKSPRGKGGGGGWKKRNGLELYLAGKRAAATNQAKGVGQKKTRQS